MIMSSTYMARSINPSASCSRKILIFKDIHLVLKGYLNINPLLGEFF